MDVTTRWIDLETPDGPMATFVVEPTEGGPYPGVVAFHAVLGHAPVWREIAQEIASHGFVFALPDMYHRLGRLVFYPHWPEMREQAMAAAGSTSYQTWAMDSKAVIDYLKTLPNVDSERIGTYGHCYGGSVAFVAAAYNPEVSSVLTVCPSALVHRPASENYPVSPIELADRINAKVLLLSGKADANPSPDDVREIGERMKALGKDFEGHVYEGEPAAGHAFFERDIPMFFNPGAVEWAWPIKWDFLRRTLQEPRVPAHA